MDQGRTVKEVFESKLERWLEDVQKDLWEMKVKRQRQKRVDRKNGHRP
jgi:hypothetical protein